MTIRPEQDFPWPTEDVPGARVSLKFLGKQATCEFHTPGRPHPPCWIPYVRSADLASAAGLGSFKLDIIASDAVPSDTGYLISGELSEGGKAEARRRIEAGEDYGAVVGELLAREKRIAKVKFGE